MRTHLKTLAVAGLTLALLGLSLWGVDLARVWREILGARPIIALAGVSPSTSFSGAIASNTRCSAPAPIAFGSGD